MRTLVCSLVLLATSLADLSSQGLVFGFGSSGMEYGKAATTDRNDHGIVALLYQGTVSPHPDANVTLTALGAGIDCMIVKYDRAGELVWARSVGGLTSTDVPHGVDTDAEGNIYVTGYFGAAGQTARSADFDPGPGEALLRSVGGFDAFVAKYRPNGDFVWVRQIAAENDTTEDRAWDIVVADDGTCVVSGAFSGTVRLDASMTIVGGETGISHFVVCYEPDGSVRWARSIPAAITNLFTEGYTAVDLTPDEKEIVFVGNFRGTIKTDDFDLAARGQTDIFLSRLSITSGDVIWHRSIGGTAVDIVSPGAMRVDSKGRFALTGRLSGPCDIGTAGTPMLMQGGSLFLASFDAAGQARFGFCMTSTTPGSGGHRVAFDLNDNIFVAGWVRGSTDFDPEQTAVEVARGMQDVFLAKYSSEGSYLFSHAFGSDGNTETDICAGMDVDSEGSVWLTGQFFGQQADYDPADIGQAFLSSIGMNDCFVAKYTTDGALWTRGLVSVSAEVLRECVDVSVEAGRIRVIARHDPLVSVEIADLQGRSICVGHRMSSSFVAELPTDNITVGAYLLTVVTETVKLSRPIFLSQ